MPPYKPRDDDVQMIAFSPGRHAEPIPGGYRCTSCGDFYTTTADLPHAKAMNWFMQHHCTPRTDRHYFDLGTNIGDTDDWLRINGYAWEPATDDVNDGLRLTRDGCPDVIAPMGSVLLWDGEEVTVEQIGPIEEGTAYDPDRAPAEPLPADVIHRQGEHPYVSTACWHGLHPRCRDSCKFCAEACRCTCHQPQQPGPDEENGD